MSNKRYILMVVFLTIVAAPVAVGIGSNTVTGIAVAIIYGIAVAKTAKKWFPRFILNHLKEITEEY